MKRHWLVLVAIWLRRNACSRIARVWCYCLFFPFQGWLVRCVCALGASAGGVGDAPPVCADRNEDSKQNLHSYCQRLVLLLTFFLPLLIGPLSLCSECFRRCRWRCVPGLCWSQWGFEAKVAFTLPAFDVVAYVLPYTVAWYVESALSVHPPVLSVMRPRIFIYP